MIRTELNGLALIGLGRYVNTKFSNQRDDCSFFLTFIACYKMVSLQNLLQIDIHVANHMLLAHYCLACLTRCATAGQYLFRLR